MGQKESGRGQHALSDLPYPTRGFQQALLWLSTPIVTPHPHVPGHPLDRPVVGQLLREKDNLFQLF